MAFLVRSSATAARSGGRSRRRPRAVRAGRSRRREASAADLQPQDLDGDEYRMVVSGHVGSGKQLVAVRWGATRRRRRGWSHGGSRPHRVWRWTSRRGLGEGEDPPASSAGRRVVVLRLAPGGARSVVDLPGGDEVGRKLVERATSPPAALRPSVSPNTPRGRTPGRLAPPRRPGSATSASRIAAPTLAALQERGASEGGAGLRVASRRERLVAKLRRKPH